MLISKEMYLFLKDYLKWAENGAFNSEPYYRFQSLCAAARRRDFKSPILHGITDELDSLFKAEGLDIKYPFGEDNFDTRYHNETQHEDPLSLRWIKSHIEEYESHNKEQSFNKLTHLLDFILNPKSKNDSEGYCFNKNVAGEYFNLFVSYVNGGSFIHGSAFQKSIQIGFNYFENSAGFTVVYDGVPSAIPLTKENLVHFFKTGDFLKGTIFKETKSEKLRPADEMYWHLWEAIMVDLQTLEHLKLVTKDISAEASEIEQGTREKGIFSLEYRERACLLEVEVEKHRKALDQYYKEKEIQETNAARDAYL